MTIWISKKSTSVEEWSERSVHETGRRLAGEAVDWASLTSRTSDTMFPAALVPPPMHGFGMPLDGGFEVVLQPVHVPLVAFPFPP